MSAIDLHTHSNASDGTDTPAQLMATARSAGLDVVGLTDHDTTEGWVPAAAALPPGLALVRGIELSCESAVPGARPIGVHLLGYLFDPAHPGLVAELARLRADRAGRGRRMTERMQDDGVDISWERVNDLAAGGIVGRPHLGQALMAARLVGSVGEAFERYLSSSGPYYLPKQSTDLAAGIGLIRAAGGVPVLAHVRARARGRIIDDATIRAAAASGLLGLEVDHPDHGPEDRRALRALAAELGLLVTGSSDYHGTNKLTPIGASRTAPQALVAIEQRATGSPVLGR